MTFPVIISASVSGTCSDDTFMMNTNTCYGTKGDILNDTLSGTEHGLCDAFLNRIFSVCILLLWSLCPLSIRLFHSLFRVL